jgi:lysozyme
MNLDKILEIGLPLIKRFEGLVLKPYMCSANVPTIGYGSTFYMSGAKVTLKDPPISASVADELLKLAVNTSFLPAVLKLCPTLQNEHQAAVILSWVYNLGAGALKDSTLRKVILAKEWSKVPTELLKWDKARVNGKLTTVRGLTVRRQAEADIFAKNTSS